MFLISVYPIIKGSWASELQYWSKDEVAPGSLIKVPLKGREILALVFKSATIHEAKGEIKEASFKIRKIEKTKPLHIVRSEYIQATMMASSFFVQPIGVMLKALIPAVALSHTTSNSYQDENKEPSGETSADIVAISTNKDDRLSVYKSLIREILAKRKSVILIAPTVRQAEELFNLIKKGIEHVSVLLHGSLTKKKSEAAWKDALAGERGKVIVATPQYICLPRLDIEAIILEKESSRAYKSFQNPYFDWRNIAEMYTKLIGIRLMYGDQLLRIDTIHRIKEMEIHEPFPLSYRIQKEAEIIVVDQKSKDERLATMQPVQSRQSYLQSEIEADDQTIRANKDEFKILSEELVSMIEYAKEKKQKMFIFACRRGLSPQTVCGHCGTTVTCKHCQAPVVLHKNQKSGDRYFLCHHCGKDRTALEACIKCGSWKLITLGIGTDTVRAEIEKILPDMPIFVVDRDNTKTESEIRRVIGEFNDEKEAAVLIGTELALSYLDQLPLVAIASMDSLFSIPDFRIHERIAHISLRLLEIATSYVLIQTRNADSPIIQAFAAKTFADFVHQELETRRILKYPPFSLMGKISLAGPVDRISKQAKRIEDMLKNYDPVIFPALVPSLEGPIINILFTLPADVWNDPMARSKHELYRILLQISQITPVHIQPESFI